jgi:beta-N-acetylhexosaminidase
MDAIREDTINKSAILKELGINVNLAPVADVSNNPNDFIYARTIGLDAEGTGKYVETVIKASKGTDVSYVLKHFPGYGNNVDTHTGIAYDQRSVESFKAVDLVPFKVGIKAGAEAVLVNHNIIVNMEDNIPASLSSKVHELLRNDMGFTGVIMTDDIAMDAIDKYVDKPSVKALLAGNDMIIISDYERGIREIKEALEAGEITEEMIDRAVMRTLAWKYYKGLM